MMERRLSFRNGNYNRRRHRRCRSDAAGGTRRPPDRWLAEARVLVDRVRRLADVGERHKVRVHWKPRTQGDLRVPFLKRRASMK